jgi:hypothetical protein
MFSITPHFVLNPCPMLASWNLFRWPNIGTYISYISLDNILLYWGVSKVSKYSCDEPITKIEWILFLLNLEDTPPPQNNNRSTWAGSMVLILFSIFEKII